MSEELDSGIKAIPKYGDSFFFYTNDQNMVENAMDLMGYGCEDYNLKFFKERKRPTVIIEKLEKKGNGK